VSSGTLLYSIQHDVIAHLQSVLVANLTHQQTCEEVQSQLDIALLSDGCYDFWCGTDL